MSAVTHEGLLSSKAIIDKKTGHAIMGIIVETDYGITKRLYQVYVDKWTNSRQYQLTLVDVETGETLAVNADDSKESASSSPFRSATLVAKVRDGDGGFGRGSYVGNPGGSVLSGIGRAIRESLSALSGAFVKAFISQSGKQTSSSSVSTQQVSVVNDVLNYDTYVLRQQRKEDQRRRSQQQVHQGQAGTSHVVSRPQRPSYMHSITHYPTITVIPRADRIVVTEGMTLYSIAKANQTSVEALKRINGLTSDLIVVGAVIQTRGPVELSADGSTVTVQSGDTLWRIATATGLTVDELKSLNQLSSDIISIGQVLKVKRATASATTVSAPSAGKTVTVKAGDTLWRIATDNGISVEELKSINQLSSNIISIGQVLKVSRATASATTVSAPSAGKTVTVKAGDTLWRIATDNGISVEELKSINQLSSNIISIGQVLQVSRAAASATTVSAPIAGKSVTVQVGDTLWAISQRYGTTVEALKQANQLTSDVISVGQTLTIPTGISVSQAKASDKDNAKAKEEAKATTQAQANQCKVDPKDLGPNVILGTLEELPEYVQLAFRGYESVNWRGTFKGQSTGTRAGGKFDNRERYLPEVDSCGKEIEYKEFDINNKKDGEKRDAERFVKGDDGSLYYTNSHYKGKIAFIKIK